MTLIEQQVRKTQHRLWMNRWLRVWGWWLTGATAAWVVAWVAVRLFSLRWPMGWAALGGLAVSIMGAIVWLVLTREARDRAAVVLDEAAGLKERISTGLHVWNNSDDPFAQAVVADAQRAVAGITARAFIPIRWPGSLSISAMCLLVGVLSLLLPEFDLLKKKETRASDAARLAELNRVRSVVAKPISAIQKIAEKSDDLNLDKELKALEEAAKRETDPSVVRRETAKHLDKVEDALKAKAESEKYQQLNETKKRFKQMASPDDPKGQLSQLMESLNRGDLKQAQEQIKKAQEQLAKNARDSKADPGKVEEMKQQLKELSDKLNKAAEDKQSERDLKNAGASEADVQRVFDALAKKDKAQLEKLAKELSERMKDGGAMKEQMEKLINKMQSRQESCKQMKEMADKMAEACKNAGQGDTQAAQDALGQAGQMLSQMEQVEQSLNDLESQMSELDKAREGMSEKGEGEGEGEKPEDQSECEQCKGKGTKEGGQCGGCKGTGKKKHGHGKGSDPLESTDEMEVKYINKREKTPQSQGGQVIGQEYVKSRQLKNVSQAELYDAAKAAEAEATDSLDKERIPRAYRRGVRTYFDRLGDQIKDGVKPATSQPAGK
mgnify:CR=1 FL=1